MEEDAMKMEAGVVMEEDATIVRNAMIGGVEVMVLRGAPVVETPVVETAGMIGGDEVMKKELGTEAEMIVLLLGVVLEIAGVTVMLAEIVTVMIADLAEVVVGVKMTTDSVISGVVVALVAGGMMMMRVVEIGVEEVAVVVTVMRPGVAVMTVMGPGVEVIVMMMIVVPEVAREAAGVMMSAKVVLSLGDAISLVVAMMMTRMLALGAEVEIVTRRRMMVLDGAVVAMLLQPNEKKRRRQVKRGSLHGSVIKLHQLLRSLHHRRRRRKSQRQMMMASRLSQQAARRSVEVLKPASFFKASILACPSV